MVHQMLSLDPSKRPTFSGLLHSARGTIFPDYFYSYLHDFFASTQNLSSSQFPYRFSGPGTGIGVKAPQRSPGFGQTGPGGTGLGAGGSNVVQGSGQAGGQGLDGDGQEVPLDGLPSDSDHRLEKLWAEFDTLESRLKMSAAMAEEEESARDGVFNVKVRVQLKQWS